MSKGLTLFEILMVLLIFSVVAAFSLPFSSQGYHNQSIWRMQQEIEHAIDYGIQKSHILGEPLLLIPLQHDNWASGLKLIRESKDQTILHTWQWPRQGARVSWHGFLSPAYLRFTPDLIQMAVNGVFTIERQDGTKIKLMVNRVGRIREAV